MANLRITGVSNNQLELQAPDGTRHHLEITPDLLKALKSREVSLPANVSPREIQQLVRFGASLDQIAEQTGADTDLIARFAKPILAELNHIVNSARGIRLSLAGDRFSDPALVEFGSVMDERLSNNQARNVSWSAKKSLEGDWLVSVSFDTPSGNGLASWSFDPKQLFLAPENETALQLSNGVPISVATKTVPIVQEVVPPAEPVVEIIERTTSLTVVPEIPDSQEQEPQDLFDVPTTSASLRIVEEVVDEVIPEPEPQIVTQTVYEEPEQTPTQVVEVLPQDEAEGNPVGTSKPQATSGWAEVLFGSRDDEEDSDR